ncbi:hypothetical protein [Mycetocola zhujimingii]|uniref:hypothetical protein n=1 Tax=Mycetocola zhujimingii TaxID=2079792 RepID=UPI0013C4A294|nr:hypothetical protein [Mycetocola zhujimingii]
MNTQFASAPARQEHPPQPSVPVRDAREVRRVGLLDRAALHLGVALVTWSRRPRKAKPGARQRLMPVPDDAGRREVEETQRQREQLRDQFLAMQLFR